MFHGFKSCWVLFGFLSGIFLCCKLEWSKWLEEAAQLLVLINLICKRM